MIYIISFLLVLSLIVIVHEFGHFIVARLCGVKVLAFSIGFGKKIWSRKDKYGTEWRICPIPLGGYVQMLGDEDAASMKQSDKNLTDEEKKHTFFAQKLYKRAAIIFAGPFMNYLFAVVLLTGILATLGYPHIPAVIGKVLDNSAAQAMDLRVGDRVLQINDRKIDDFSELQRTMMFLQKGEPAVIYIARGDQKLKLRFTPAVNQNRPQLGVMSDITQEYTFEKYSVPLAFVKSWVIAYEMSRDTLNYLVLMISGERSADELRGPLGIAEASGDAMRAGFVSFILFMIQISVSVGLLNLLPLPVLDGGHLALYAVEAVTRRKVSKKVETWGMRLGLLLLFLLFTYTLWKDIPRIVGRIFS